MIRNLNSIRNTLKEIDEGYSEYRENDVSFMGIVMDTKTNETSCSYIGDTMDFFYMLGTICTSFYEQAELKKVFSTKEFVDCISEGLNKLFDTLNDKKRHKNRR